VFSFAKTHFEDISIWLTLLKYLGLCLAAGSSIWGTVNELTTKTVGGKRHVTRAGIIAISFTILGLVISLVSEDLQRRASEASQKAEVRRTNKIIVFGQPLTSLALHWRFSSSNADLWKIMTDGQAEIDKNAETEQGGSPEVPYEAEDYEQALMPLLSFIARVGDKSADASKSRAAKNDNKTIVTLASLDPSSNAILSFGSIDSNSEWYNPKKGRPLSAGFLSRIGFRTANSLPHATAETAASSGGASHYRIDWDLDPSTFAHAINRANPDVTPTAKLPKTLKMAIFYDAGTLPFEENNFAVAAANLMEQQ
jgi:hypothetical protein